MDLEVVERNDYYPFGLRRGVSSSPVTDNRYRYNGKEEQFFAGVPYIDYGARQYDPLLCRWLTQDELLEKYYGLNPYVFCGNNPIRYVDRDGRKIVDIKNNVLFENGRWTDFAKNTDAMRVGRAMMNTAIGRIVWNEMSSVDYEIVIVVHSDEGPRKELGRTDVTKVDGNVSHVDIHIYEGSIDKQVESQYNGERAKRLRPLSKEDRIGAMGVHEGKHAVDTVNKDTQSREAAAIDVEKKHVRAIERKTSIVSEVITFEVHSPKI